MLKTINKRRSRQRGLQLIEMAFIMPLMVMLLGAIGEFGRYFHMRSTLLRATRAGAGYMWDKQSNATEIQSAKRMALCGQTTTGCSVASELVYPGLTENNFKVKFETNTSGNYVVVYTDNAMYVPLFKLTALTKSTTPWGSRAVTVNTRMRYTQTATPGIY